VPAELADVGHPGRIDVDVGRARELELAATVDADQVQVGVVGVAGGIDDRAPAG